MKWEFVGTGLALIGLGLAPILALPPPWWPKMPHDYVKIGVVVGIFVAVAGLGLTIAGLRTDFSTKPVAPILITIGLILVISGFVWHAFRGAEPASTPSPVAPLFLECALGTLPATVPPSGAVWAMQLQGSGGGGDVGFMQMSGVPGANLGRMPLVGQMYKCQLTNYNQDPVSSVTLSTKLEYIEAIRKDDSYSGGKYIGQHIATITIQKIDPGKDDPFIFYIWNMSREFVQLTFLEKSTLRFIGKSENSEARIEQAVPVTTITFGPRPE
jgi:hypothetical protein